MTNLTQYPNDGYGLPKIPSVAKLGNCYLSTVYLVAVIKANPVSKGFYRNVLLGADEITYKSGTYVWYINSSVIISAP